MRTYCSTQGTPLRALAWPKWEGNLKKTPSRGYMRAYSWFPLWFSGNWSAGNNYVCVRWLQARPALCDLVDCSPPGSSVRGVFQARILEWVAISYSRGSNYTPIKIICLKRVEWGFKSSQSCTRGCTKTDLCCHTQEDGHRVILW